MPNNGREVYMDQRTFLKCLLVFVFVSFSSLVIYDFKYGHKFEKLISKTSVENWKWDDKWGNKDNDSLKNDVSKDEPKKEIKDEEQIIADDFNQAIKMSGETGKPILMFFTADWCGWCKKMKKDVLTDEFVKTSMKNYIFVTIDTDKQKHLARKFKISGLPSYLITNCDQEELKIGSGYADPKKFLNWLDNSDMYNQPKKHESEKSPKIEQE